MRNYNKRRIMNMLKRTICFICFFVVTANFPLPADAGEKLSIPTGQKIKLPRVDNTYYGGNNKMQLYIGEHTSNGWDFNFNGIMARTSYYEHYAVWYDNTIHYSGGDWGYGIFELLDSFGEAYNDADNVCKTKTGNIEIQRSVFIPPGDATYFKISYILKNVGNETIADVRFYEIVDFDIPWTGDHWNDFGWYDPRTDFVWIQDAGWFQNGFSGNRKSSHHGTTDYYTELFYDAPDGDLNDAGEYSGDPAIGLQWNAGDLAPGQTWGIEVTFWFGQPNKLFAEAGAEQITYEGRSVNFDASGSIAEEGNIVAYNWDMDGDGQYDDATGVNPVYTFQNQGTYSVFLQVIDNSGNMAYDSCNVTVLPSAFKNVTVRDWLPSNSNLLNPGSISPADAIVSFDGENYLLEWKIGSMNVGDLHKLSYEVEITAPMAGEARMVERELELSYNNRDGNAQTVLSGPSFVDVISGYGIKVDADKDSYMSPDPATFTTTATLPDISQDRTFSTGAEFKTCKLNNLSADIKPGSLVLAQDDSGNYAVAGTASFIIKADSSAKWGKVYFNSIRENNDDITIRTRSAASEELLKSMPFSNPVSASGTDIASEKSLFLEVMIIMKSGNVTRSPVLEDIKVSYYTDDTLIRVQVNDINGKPVEKIADIQVSGSEYGRQLKYIHKWNTERFIPERYTVCSSIINSKNGSVLEKASDSFIISGQPAAAVLNGRITTDKITYSANETINILSRISNNSTNSPMNNLTVQVDIASSGGNIIKTYSYAVSNLMPGGSNDKDLSYIVSQDMTTGTYTASQTLFVNQSNVFVNQTAFEIVSSVEQGKGISGTVSATPLTVKRKSGSVALNISAKNIGNVDLTGVNLKTNVYDPVTLQTAQSYVHTADLSRSGTPATANFTCSNLSLAPGSYPVTLTAELAYKGQSISIPLDVNGFTVTNDPPVANAGADQKIEGTSVDGMSVVLSGSGSTDGNSTNPPQMNDDVVSYEWSEGATILGTGPTLNHTFPWGAHTVKLTVKDTLGATGADEVVVNIGDTIAPVISEQTPPHNQISALATPVFNARLSDSCSGIKASSIVLTVDGAALAANYNSTTGDVTATPTTALADGWHNIVLKVSDNAGNPATSQEWKIGVDTKGPNITDLGPVNNAITTNPASALSVRAVDAFSLVNATSITLTLDGTALAANYDAASGMITATPAAALADGWHNAALRIKDNAGNESVSPEWKIGVDTAPPQITEMMPVSNIITANSKPGLSVKVSDSFSGIKANSIVLTVDGAALTANYDAASGMITATPATALADGWHNVVLKVSDIAGNQATSAEWKIGVDATPPQITGMTPAPGSALTASPPEISAVVTDSFSGINSGTIQLSVNSAVIAHTYDAQTGKVTVSSPVLQSGGNSIVLTVKDMAGNQKTSDTWTITVQSQQPKDYLLFHNSSGGTLSITGSGKTVNGKAHSNADIKVSGSGNTISGQTTAVGSIKITGSGNNIPNKQSGASAQPIPVYSLSYYQQHATYTHSGTWHISGSGEQIPAGIHFVNGDVKISGSNVSGNVTIVATGYIRISGSNITLSSSDASDSMLLFSMNDIQLSGSGDTLRGIIYAPAGECSLSGSGKNIRGAVIGSKAGITGSNITISPLN